MDTFQRLPWYLRQPILFYGGLFLMLCLFALALSKATLTNGFQLRVSRYLIVLFIVVFLTVTFALNPIEENLVARDQTRIANLTSVHRALQKGPISDGFFISGMEASDVKSGLLADSYVGITKPNRKKVMNRLPYVFEDPVNNEEYKFVFNSDGQNYTLTAKLESPKYKKFYGDYFYVEYTNPPQVPLP